MKGATPFTRQQLRLNKDNDPFIPCVDANFHEESILDEMSKKGKIGETKLAICITMYNEDWKEFDDTMTGILMNVKQMQTAAQRTNNSISDKIVVFLIADGYDRLGKDYFDKAEKLGLCNRKLITDLYGDIDSTSKLCDLWRTPEGDVEKANLLN